MRLLKNIPPLFLLACISFCGNNKPYTTLQKTFTVVELFTSEGCSSCPPADELLQKIDKEYANRNVLVLSYHVDYWNRLGWKDPFSSGASTDRQNYYAQLFGLNSIYTPQAVINGEKEFVGSDATQMMAALKSTKEERGFSITAQEKNNKVFVPLNTMDWKSGEVVLVALVQKQGSSRINKGENEGKELHHVHIVRDFIIPAGKTSRVEFDLPGTEKNNYFVAAILQNKKTGVIFGYATAPIQ